MPALPPLPIATEIFTFYSFKGGVGRSMALVNTAAQLARAGRRVLAIDLDLEAPGLSYLARKKAKFPKRGGFVDALFDLLTEQERSPLGDSGNTTPFSDYIMKLDLSDTAQSEDGGIISVLSAGNLDHLGEYQRRMNYLEFGRLYREGLGAPLLSHFKERLITSELFDYVLIDSRTGFSTESTIAVRDLADHLVVVTGLNHQNVEGTCCFLSALHGESTRPKSLTIVISPIPLGEDDLATKRINLAGRRIRAAWPSLKPRGLREIRIPYHPRLALDERPHRERLTNQTLTQAYRQIYQTLRTLANDSLSDYADAVRKQLNENSPRDTIPYLARLIAVDYRGAYEMARSVLRKTSDATIQSEIIELLRPTLTSSWENALAVAELFESKKEWLSARKILDAYTKENPLDVPAWMAKGKLFETIHLKAGATACFSRASRIAPTDPWVWNRLACHLWEIRGRMKAAHIAFSHWLRLESKKSWEHSNFAEYCIASGRFEVAKKHLVIAWQNMHPEGPTYHLLLCTALLCCLSHDSLEERRQLRRLVWLFKHGGRTLSLTFDASLKHSNSRLSGRDFRFYQLLAQVVQGRRSVEELSSFHKWKGLKALRPKGKLFAR